MEKPSNLKSFLESSLNEIFKATVSDILESVEETLAEYQDKIQMIETENEDLRRRLYESDIRIKTESKGMVMRNTTVRVALLIESFYVKSGVVYVYVCLQNCLFILTC